MKDTYYFPHDYNAAHDQKILKLRAKHDNALGYGIYFMILEMMAQEPTGILPDDFIETFNLSYGFPNTLANGSANGYTSDVLQTCIDLGLFIKDKTGIYSKRMLEHKGFRQERSISGQKGAKNRWNNNSANGSAITSANNSANAKERKGKEIYKKDDFSSFHETKPRMTAKEWIKKEGLE